MPESARDQLLQKLRTSLDDDSLVKLTLSKPRERTSDLRNVYGRFVDLKAGRMVSLTLRYGTKDVVRNIEPAEVASQVGSLLADVFEEAHLFTTTRDWKLKAQADGSGFLKSSRPTFSSALPTTHDRAKQRAMVGSPFLAKLGVTDEAGVARAGMADKLRQIERFVEILGHLVAESPLREKSTVSACDMGAGKGYLTFAAYEFFRRRGASVSMTGVELREDLVEQTNRVAGELNHEGLQFVRGTIGNFTVPQELDLLIALHACDTATDDALAAGVRAGASLLVVSPCCHKEIRRQMGAPPLLREVLSHGILAERQAELLTDGLRAMVLEECGYETRVFEFIAHEHTGKNVMIAAIRRGAGSHAFERVHQVMDEFGIERFRLLDAVDAIHPLPDGISA